MLIWAREGKANWKSASLWLSACLWGGRALQNGTVNSSPIMVLTQRSLPHAPREPPTPSVLCSHKGLCTVSRDWRFSALWFSPVLGKMNQWHKQSSDFTPLVCRKHTYSLSAIRINFSNFPHVNMNIRLTQLIWNASRLLEQTVLQKEPFAQPVHDYRP